MKQYQFIVPTTRDSDKKLHDPKCWADLTEKLLNIAGGFTTDYVLGYWKDGQGKIVCDSSIRYTVALENSFPVTAGMLLKDILKTALSRFDQQCIYFVHPDGTAELISP